MIVISGSVDDDVRIAGQILKVEEGGSIGDDLIAAAFSLECALGSSVDGELSYSGYQARLRGEIEGDVQAAVANCEIAGRVTSKCAAISPAGISRL